MCVIGKVWFCAWAGEHATTRQGVQSVQWGTSKAWFDTRYDVLL